MTNKFKQQLMFLLIVGIFTSCSNKPDEPTIKKIISEYESQEMTKYSNYLIEPCGAMKSIKIPKNISIAFFPTDPEMTAIFQNQKSILDGLSLQKIIKMNFVQETSGVNADGVSLTKKEYTINLDPSSESNKLGETADEYVLPLFDFNNIEILNEKYRAKDTLVVTYKLNELPTYEVLKQNCLIAKYNFLPKNDSSVVVIVNNGTNWEKKK